MKKKFNIGLFSFPARIIFENNQDSIDKWNELDKKASKLIAEGKEPASEKEYKNAYNKADRAKQKIESLLKDGIFNDRLNLVNDNRKLIFDKVLEEINKIRKQLDSNKQLTNDEITNIGSILFNIGILNAQELDNLITGEIPIVSKFFDTGKYDINNPDDRSKIVEKILNGRDDKVGTNSQTDEETDETENEETENEETDKTGNEETDGVAYEAFSEEQILSLRISGIKGVVEKIDNDWVLSESICYHIATSLGDVEITYDENISSDTEKNIWQTLISNTLNHRNIPLLFNGFQDIANNKKLELDLNIKHSSKV